MTFGGDRRFQIGDRPRILIKNVKEAWLQMKRRAKIRGKRWESNFVNETNGVQ